MKFLNFPSTTISSKIRNILLAYLAIFTYIFLISKFLDFLEPPEQLLSSSSDSIPPFIYLLNKFFFGVIWAPLWEELSFRHAPALIAKGLGEKFLIPIMIISSVLFGWGHGNGSESLLLQGVMGFVFFIVYVKNNYSYWSSVTLHAMWNGGLFLSEYHKYILKF